MTYSIEEINILDDNTELEIRELIKSAFKDEQLLPYNYILNNIKSNASKPSFFLAAKENNKFIGCLGFLANDFVLNGKSYVGYQMCWAAVHPLHQGKKVFVNIVNEAKKILHEDGAGFLYAGPANKNSYPIFIHKLNFKELFPVRKRIINTVFTPLIKFRSIKEKIFLDVCSINEEQVKNYKLLQFRDDIKVIFFKESWLWGKIIRKQIIGIKISIFYVGGIYLKDQNDLKQLIQMIFKSYNILFIELFCTISHTLYHLIRNWQKPKVSPGFVFFNLNLPKFNHLNLMIGAIDVF